MVPSDRELERQTLRLIRAVIVKTTREKKKWFGSWDRVQLLELGYSEHVVAKARDFDRRQSMQITTFNFGLWAFVAFPDSRILWLATMSF